jgi:hypothetical protein
MNQMNQMDCCMGMNTATMGWMMGGMGIIGVLLLILILLGIAALVKYLFFGKPKPAKPEGSV